MRKLPQLVPISYRDADNGISLKCYADTIVYLRENNKTQYTVEFRLKLKLSRTESSFIPRESVIEKNYHTMVFMPNQ